MSTTTTTIISIDSVNMQSPCVVQQQQQEDVSSLHSLLPFAAAGYTAPPPTPLASIPPVQPSPDFVLPPAPLHSQPADVAYDTDVVKKSFPSSSSSSSTTSASPPSKADLDALAQYLMHHSLHSTPNLLAPLTLHRKRRTSMNATAPTPPDNEKEIHVLNSRNSIDIGAVVQTFNYSGGFCEESRRGIEEACQDVGAFYIAVQDAEEDLAMSAEQHSADDESCIIEGGLIPIFQLLTSTSQHHQHDMLDLEQLAFDCTAIDANSRFVKLLSRISKDLLRFLLDDLSIETQANIRGHSLKPLLYIHGNGKQELNLDDDVVLFLSHYTDIHEGDKRVLFLARLGTQLQAWSEGKYKAPFLRSSCKNGNGEVGIQFVLIQHH